MMIRSGRERIAWKYLVVFTSDGMEEVSVGGTTERLCAQGGIVFQAPEVRKGKICSVSWSLGGGSYSFANSVGVC